MEDLKKDELQENAAVEEKAPVKPRNYTFMGIAALYLVYLGYELCMGFVQGKEGSNIGFFLMGVVFIGFGIAVVVYAVKGSRRRHAMMKAAEAAAAAAQEKEENEQVSEVEVKTEVPKKMSISERARMVNNLENDSEDAE